MAKYYCLIAGLSDLTADDAKAPFTQQSFRDEIYPSLTAADRKLMDLLPLENDCRNLLSLLRGADDRTEPCLFSREELERLIAAVKADDRAAGTIPGFMYDFVKDYLQDSMQGQADDRLFAMYYAYAMKAGNAFVRDWFGFCLDMGNVQTAVTARRYGLDVRQLIVGEGDVADALRTSGARDWGLSQQLPFFDELMRIMDEPDLALRERRTDMLKWNWLEENTFFDYFTVERLFSYMVRLGIVTRWTGLDADRGQQLFRRLIDGLKGQVSVPDEFGNN